MDQHALSAVMRATGLVRILSLAELGAQHGTVWRYKVVPGDSERTASSYRSDRLHLLHVACDVIIMHY